MGRRQCHRRGGYFGGKRVQRLGRNRRSMHRILADSHAWRLRRLARGARVPSRESARTGSGSSLPLGEGWTRDQVRRREGVSGPPAAGSGGALRGAVRAGTDRFTPPLAPGAACGDTGEDERAGRTGKGNSASAPGHGQGPNRSATGGEAGGDTGIPGAFDGGPRVRKAPGHSYESPALFSFLRRYYPRCGALAVLQS
jgi:hypothetical protein